MDDSADRRKHQISPVDAHCCWCRCHDDAPWSHVDVHGCKQLHRKGWKRCFWLIVLLTSLGGFFVAISNDLWPLLAPKSQSLRYRGNRLDAPIHSSSSPTSSNSFGFFYSRAFGPMASGNESTTTTTTTNRVPASSTTLAKLANGGEDDSGGGGDDDDADGGGGDDGRREIGLTVCNLNPLRILELGRNKWPLVYDLPHHSAILKEMMTTTGDVMIDWEKVNVSSSIVFDRAGHSADNMIVSCSSDLGQCTSKNFSSVHTEKGLCQRIVTKAKRLHLLLNSQLYESIPNSKGQKGIVVVPDHQSTTSNLLTFGRAQIFLPLNKFIKVTLYGDHSEESDEGHCFEECGEKLILNRCHCLPHWGSSRMEESTARGCMMHQHISCVTQTIEEMENKLEKLCDHCPESNHRFHWDYSITEVPSLSLGNPALSPTFTISSYPSSQLFSSSQSSTFNSPMYQIPSLAHHLAPTAKLHAAVLTKAAEDRCSALDLLARSYPDILKKDFEHISRLSFLVDKIRRLVESSVVTIGRAKEEAGILTTNLMRRITFHVHVGLKGLQESYESGFVAPFIEVSKRSLKPLTSKIHEIASQLERTVKQLKFASPTDSVARKVLYHMADNQLSGKLETAIQVMDNFTKVYQAFQNSAPMLEQLDGFRVYHLPQGKASPLLKSHTPEGRYDIHLVPYALLARVQQKDLSRFYKGITENTARLIEHVMALKVTLKEAYQDSHFNETGFEAARVGFIIKSAEIEHYELLFQKEIVEEIQQQIINRSNFLTQLNISLESTTGKLQDSLSDIIYLLRTQFSESNTGLIAFSQLSQQYLKDHEMKRSELFSSENDKSVRASLSALSELFHEAKSTGSKKIATLCSELTLYIEKTWQAMLNDSLLRNFYTNIYNDINDVLSRPQQSQLKRILLDMLAGIYNSDRSDVLKRIQVQLQQPQQQQTRHYHQQNSLLLNELYSFLNADLPTLSPEHKKAEASEIFTRLTDSTDIVKVLAGNDADLFQAFRHFRESVSSTQSSCQKDDQSLRDNFIFVDINLRTWSYSSSAFSSPSSKSQSSSTFRSRTGHSSNEDRPWSTYIAHAGGLLAFFTGGSLISIFQILSIILRSPCRCWRRCGTGRKKDATGSAKCSLGNHILLNPNEASDENIVANSSVMRSNNNSSLLQTHPFRASKPSQGSSPSLHYQHRLQGYSTLPTSLGSITMKTTAPNNVSACQRSSKPLPTSCSPRVKLDCNSSSKQKSQCTKKPTADRFYKQAETDI